MSLLLDSAERLFGDTVTPTVLAAAERGEFPHAAWHALSEAGLHLALLPEAAGGFGVPDDEALDLLRVAGRHALPLPLAETMLAGWLLSAAGLPVPAGCLSIATGLRLGPGGHLSGTAHGVPWGRNAEAIAALTDDGQVALATAGFASVEMANIAREPRDAVAFDVIPELIAPAPLSALELRAAGAATRTLLIAGALEQVTAMTAQYALDRTQFGRPIGRFQAVQHSLAILASQTAAAVAAAGIAAEAFAALSLPAIAAAKARAAEAAGIGAALAHQIHGAIGFTYEHRLHFFTKRLHAWRDEHGGEAEWNERLGRHLAAAGADALWPTLTAI
jgi:alkylation response protein AidB-like acyl-CoA dehydrogenase